MYRELKKYLREEGPGEFRIVVNEDSTGTIHPLNKDKDAKTLDFDLKSPNETVDSNNSENTDVVSMKEGESIEEFAERAVPDGESKQTEQPVETQGSENKENS